MFTAVLFMTVNTWKRTKYPSMDKWINRMEKWINQMIKPSGAGHFFIGRFFVFIFIHTHTMEYYSVIKRRKYCNF